MPTSFTEDRPLNAHDVGLLTSPDALARFFAHLGYPDDTRLPMTPEALGLNRGLTDATRHVERLTSVDDVLQIYLFTLTTVTVAATRALARAFRDRGSDFLLILTDDYRRLDFVLLDRELRPGARTTLVRPRVLTVDRRDPDRVALRVLRRFTFTEVDEDGDPDPYAQYDKLRSAFTIAEWSEPLFNNRALFSDYYLHERLPELAIWNAPERNCAFREIRRTYAEARPRLRRDPTAAPEALIAPVLRLLGFDLQPGPGGAQADLLLHAPKAVSGSTDAAAPHLGDPGGKPCAFALTYPYHRYLDGKDAKDPLRPDENPGAQVVSLLDQEVAPWAIVTNGKTWRLYSARAHSRATNYYEIDLEEILALPDPGDAFRYAYLLFRAAAFSELPPPPGEGWGEGRAFLDWLLDESTAYARELGERLKVRVFEEIFPHFAAGFIAGSGGSEALLALPDDAREARLQLVFDATLTFLYRLLFLLYAESRDLLPVRELRGYRTISLRRLKESLAEKAGSIEDLVPERLAEAFDTTSTGLYDHLKDLFAVIAEGSAAHNVPTYDGGLFRTAPAPDDDSRDAATARFLLATSMPDGDLALGLDRLARDLDPKQGKLGFIDYKSLGVRQLGSIYEGLLEFKVRVAPETMAVVAGAKTEEIVPYAEARSAQRKLLTRGRGANALPRTLVRGTVYLENDRRERKATGSYYTPDYIVKYIVRHTVGPVMDEKLDALRPRLQTAERQFRAVVKRKIEQEGVKPELLNRPALLQDVAGDLLRDLFDVKILDPAMGSGHFLVEAVDYVTDRLVRFLDGYPFLATFFDGMRAGILEELQRQQVTVDPAQLTDVTLLKRHVLKRCIYGVDLNPMAVELAKVSLWLDCFTLGAPLSFLDHHLRCGNSLIGAMARDVAEEMAGAGPAGQMTFLTGPFVGLLRAAEIMRGISNLTDVTLEQVRESDSLFKAFDRAAKPYKQLLDIHVARHFGVDRTAEFLKLYGVDTLRADPGSLAKPYQDVLEQARVLYEDKRFFHWDLEFPEVFIDLQRANWIEDGGFDAVIGNPPYLAFHEGTPRERDYYREKYAGARGKYDQYVLFIERSITLVRDNGFEGMICPNRYLTAEYGNELRKWLVEQANCYSVLDFSDYPVFEDVTTYASIEIARRGADRAVVKYATFDAEQHSTGDLSHITESATSVPPGMFVAGKALGASLELMLFWERLSRTQSLVPLGAITDGIFQGIRTGNQQIYYIDVEVARAFQIEEAALRVAIGNEHVRRYLIDGSAAKDKRLIYPYCIRNGRAHRLSESSIPNLLRYLEQHRTELEQRKNSGRYITETNLRWWELWDACPGWAQPRIIVPDISDHNRFAYDANAEFAPLNIVYSLNLCEDAPIGYLALLAILNSSLVEAFIRSVSRAQRGGYYRYQTRHLSQIPIPVIDFSERPEERQETLKKLRNLSSHDPDVLLDQVQGSLAAGDKDVIHDVLAYLAEQMIAMHKEKQARVDAFWHDLEVATDPATFDTLRTKGKWEQSLAKDPACAPYVDPDSRSTRTLDESLGWDAACFEAFTGLLVGRTAVTPALTRVYEAHAPDYRALVTRIQETDELNDQIVYRLYGLTDDEIAVVEGRG